MSFDVGDKVVYPHHGAAVVERRESKEAFGEKKEYLVLRLAYGDLTLMVPADNTEEVGLREVINDEEVEEVFAVLRKKDVRMPTNWSRRYKNHVEKLKSGDIYQVAEVVRNLSNRDKDKGLSAGEKRMLNRARQILVSELTFAIGVTRRRPRRSSTTPSRRPAGPWKVWAVVVAAGTGAASARPSSSADSAAGRSSTGRSTRPARRATASSSSVPADRREGAGGADRVVTGGATRSASVRAGLAAVPAGPTSSSSTTPPARWPGAALWTAVIDAVAPGRTRPSPPSRSRTRSKVVGTEVTWTPGPGPSWWRCRPHRRSGPRCCGGPTRPARRRPTTPPWWKRSGRAGVGRRTTPTISRSPCPPISSCAEVWLPMTPRVGLGFDIHPFSDDPARRLVLGGVSFEGAGLVGHSDADVVAHAIADALWGRPDWAIWAPISLTTTRPAGHRQHGAVGRVVLTVSTHWGIGNVDATVILEAPRLAPHRDAMEHRLADVVGASVSVKAKRAEALGALGRGEGIACFAVALLMPR